MEIQCISLNMRLLIFGVLRIWSRDQQLHASVFIGQQLQEFDLDNVLEFGQNSSCINCSPFIVTFLKPLVYNNGHCRIVYSILSKRKNSNRKTMPCITSVHHALSATWLVPLNFHKCIIFCKTTFFH